MPPNTIKESNLDVEKEIRGLMQYCNLCIRSVGLSFTDDTRNLKEKWMTILLATLCFLALFIMYSGEMVHFSGLIMSNSKSAFMEIVPDFHLFIYVFSSLSKLTTLWVKRPVFKKLITELANIWPKDMKNEEEQNIKRSSIAALRRLQFWYIFFNIFGLTFYCVTPIVLTVYHRLRGLSTEPAFIWFIAYPFDKRDPVLHKFVYIFEIFSGYSGVGGMLSSEIMFQMMASNISMLLRILQSKIRKLDFTSNLNDDDIDDSQSTSNVSLTRRDNYDEIVAIIKIHQRLFGYSVDLEDAFSMLNLSSVMLSSVMICCVVFDIVLLDPWMEVSNKVFLVAVLTQIGIMCWYADDVYRSSLSVADAVYECAWYEATPRCRRALLLIIIRSQKPLCFTAYKFSNITLTTYSSILTTSYSYFALLYSMFK